MLPAQYIVNAILCTVVAAAPALVDQEHATKRGVFMNSFMGLILNIFPVNTLVTTTCGSLTTGQLLLSTVFNLDTTRDSSSNVGALVGPPLFKAIAEKLPGKSINVQGVKYPASVEGYLGADGASGKKMAELVKSTSSSCPDTKIVLGGYSQGGYAIHHAASALGDTMSNVSAVVIFGDPMSGEAVSNIDAANVRIVCHDGDDICKQGIFIMPQHLTYANDAAASADFIAARV
ncbi:hypothetical protein LLEC1_05877 [Akanthomyces lecanii]|uniref:Cutinase n=1 Tax=Cordyceps confragosa TaxID=2714763 RepID=A0A179I300_CORDF|nr:hypothetical protein LLEC1_05877 [Akanthomyces lecanii]